MASSLTEYHNMRFSSDSSSKEAFPRIVCLAEEHDIEGDARRNALLIDRLYQPGDVVLVEYPSTDAIDQSEGQTRYVRKKIKVLGWDSAEGREPMYVFGRKASALLDEYESLLTADLNDPLVRSKVIKICNTIGDIGASYLIRQYCSEVPFRSANSSLIKKQLITDIEYYCSLAFADWATTAQTRNLSAVETIDKCLKSNNRIFFIAGKAHLGEELDFIGVCPNSKIISDYLKKTSSVILSPKKESLKPPKKTCGSVLWNAVAFVASCVGSSVATCRKKCCQRSISTATKTEKFNPHPSYLQSRINHLRTRAQLSSP